MQTEIAQLKRKAVDNSQEIQLLTRQIQEKVSIIKDREELQGKCLDYFLCERKHKFSQEMFA